jgi:hypothetical protein
MIGGVELRKQRNLGDIVSDAFTILFAAWKPLAMIAIPIVVFTIAAQLILYVIDDDIALAFFDNTELQERVDDPGYEFNISPFSILLGLVAIPVGFILTVLTSGGLVAFLNRTDAGETVASADALDDAQGRLGPLTGASLRVFFICLLLSVTIIGIPFAIYRIVRWYFISQVIMVEGVTGEAVLARSAELVEGKWWNTLGRLIVMGLVIQIPVGLLSSALSAAFPGVGGILLSSATAFVTTPFGIIASTLMFFDLYVRKAPAHDDDAVPNPA